MTASKKERLARKSNAHKGAFLERIRVIKDASNYITEELAKIGAVPTQYRDTELGQAEPLSVVNQSANRKHLLG